MVMAVLVLLLLVERRWFSLVVMQAAKSLVFGGGDRDHRLHALT